MKLGFIAAVSASLVFCSAGIQIAAAKDLEIENDTGQQILSMTIETEDKDRKQKRKQSHGLKLDGVTEQDKKDRDKGKGKRSRKKIAVEVAEEECLADVEFAMVDGKLIKSPKMDLCGLKGIVVEETLASATPSEPVPPN